MHWQAQSSRTPKIPIDQRDPEVLAFLKAGRNRAALKRLKHLDRAACAADVVQVVTEIAHSDAFEQSRRLISDVLDRIGPLHRLQSCHKEGLRAALAQHRFDHPAIADTAPHRITDAADSDKIMSSP